MRLRAILAAAAGLAASRLSALPPLQPKLDASGNYVHEAAVAVSVVAVSPAGLTLECRRPDGAGGVDVWRERYAVQDGKLTLVSISTQHDVPAQPAHTEWQETEVREAPSPAVVPAKVGGTDLRGAMVDPRWASFPAYLQKVVQAIQAMWDHERITQKLYSHAGNRVAVKFVLNAQGAIARIDGVEFSPGTADQAVRACVNAIVSPAPYPAWTEDMIATLGTEQTLNLAFYYP